MTLLTITLCFLLNKFRALFLCTIWFAFPGGEAAGAWRWPLRLF